LTKKFCSLKSFFIQLGKKKNKLPLELPLQPGDGDGPVTINDLLLNIEGKPGYSKLRKRLQQQEKGPKTVSAPLSKSERERLDRGVTYNLSKKEITKWEHLIKRNREAPTLYFENDVNLGVNSVGAIASEFKPRTKFEKEMAQILQSKEMMEAHKNDGAKILELNKVYM
jgi:U3 small nucleolar RNA-associated protein 14